MASVVSTTTLEAYERARLESMAWSEVVRTVHRQMRSLVGPTRELEDLVQSALERVVAASERFEGRAAFSTFTYRICVHVAMNHWRWWKRWLRRFDLGYDAVRVEASTEPDDDHERLVRLHRALDRLSPPQRMALVLLDLEGLAGREVAEILRCPEPTVRSRVRAARRTLEALLRDDPFFREDER